MKKVVFFICGVLLSGCEDNSTDEMVYISNNSIQCEYQGDLPEVTANILVEAGIDVLESNCGHVTGGLVLSVCGAGTTGINIHTIRSVNIDDAEKLGFHNLLELENEYDEGYQIVECRT